MRVFSALIGLALALTLLAAAPARADDLQAESTGVGLQATTSELPPRVAPVELKIPSLAVDADIYPVGEDDDGAMTAPADPDTVAWWSLGPGTGEPGNMVLAGHVDWGGRLRVFGLLYRLEPGDRIVVIDEQLREYFYEVESSRRIPAEDAPVEEIFASSDRAELTLITCGGEFDHATRQYLDRLIVRAHLV
jgi:LPXTG-site transpeptidase (sortase) family protein